MSDDDNELLPKSGSDDGEEADEDRLEFYDEEAYLEEELDDEDFFEDFSDYNDPIHRPFDLIDSSMDKLLAVSTVDAVYGEPIEHGENLIIPAAELLSTMGFGVGYGSGSGGDSEESETSSSGEGTGGGGGGYAFSRPVAVIIAGPDGVRVEPVVDVTKIALTFLTAVGFMAGAAARMMRRS